jgi:hypothetical protein
MLSSSTNINTTTTTTTTSNINTTVTPSTASHLSSSSISLFEKYQQLNVVIDTTRQERIHQEHATAQLQQEMQIIEQEIYCLQERIKQNNSNSNSGSSNNSSYNCSNKKSKENLSDHRSDNETRVHHTSNGEIDESDCDINESSGSALSLVQQFQQRLRNGTYFNHDLCYSQNSDNNGKNKANYDSQGLEHVEDAYVNACNEFQAALRTQKLQDEKFQQDIQSFNYHNAYQIRHPSQPLHLPATMLGFTQEMTQALIASHEDLPSIHDFVDVATDDSHDNSIVLKKNIDSTIANDDSQDHRESSTNPISTNSLMTHSTSTTDTINIENEQNNPDDWSIQSSSSVESNDTNHNDTDSLLANSVMKENNNNQSHENMMKNNENDVHILRKLLRRYRAMQHMIQEKQSQNTALQNELTQKHESVARRQKQAEQLLAQLNRLNEENTDLEANILDLTERTIETQFIADTLSKRTYLSIRRQSMQLWKM